MEQQNLYTFDGKGFVNSKQIIGLVRQEIENLLPPSPVPVVSDMALRKIGGSYYLAAFIYFYTIHELIGHELARPKYWVLIDIVDGRIVRRLSARKADFTLAPFNQLYSMKMGAEECDVTREYYREQYKKLDDVRLKFLQSGEIDRDTYFSYVQGILRNMPIAFRDIFKDLSDLTGAKRIWEPSVAEGAMD